MLKFFFDKIISIILIIVFIIPILIITILIKIDSKGPIFYTSIRIGKNNKLFTIGCIANFWKIKDQITLIKSVHLLLKNGINCQLRLIGSGTTLMSCKKYVLSNSLNENIFFENELPHEELNKFYNEIDLFVLPSYYEALGCVYLESWATQTPFIAIENQGISEVLSIRNKKIFLTEKENIFLLRDRIKFFMDNKVNLVFNSELYIENSIQNLIKKIDKLAL